jgi:hypothetical protein
MKREDMSAEDKNFNRTLYYDFYSNTTTCGESVGHTGSIETKPAEQRPATNK